MAGVEGGWRARGVAILSETRATRYRCKRQVVRLASCDELLCLFSPNLTQEEADGGRGGGSPVVN